MTPLRVRLAVCFLAIMALPDLARAELIKLEIVRREPFAEGKAFGDVGEYERIFGIARFAVEPGHARNRAVVDLDKAPVNEQKRVEFEADFFILAPKDPAKGNGAIFYDVNNRGNKLALGFFNRAPGGNDPSKAADAGDGFLMRRGYTVVWSGWITELLPGSNRLLLRTPIAVEGDKPHPIRGLVRQEMVLDAPAESIALSRRPGHGSFRPTRELLHKATLTWRMRETDARVPIPREQWSLEEKPMVEVKDRVAGTLPEIRLKVRGGMRLGYIYELIYLAEAPPLQGLGFVATRDLISFLKYDASDRNPLRASGKPVIKRAHGFGVSQSGRFLRHFLYQGFNIDEKERKVFDGLMPHVAGGGLGYFNHRFAQPNRHNGQHEDHSYPADVFPFTYGDSDDKPAAIGTNAFLFPDRVDGILKRTREAGDRFVPKVMHTQSAAEYWHRSGSLVHTHSDGELDAIIPETVRIYAFGGTQHGPAADPPGRGLADNLHNPGDYKPQLRALLDALDAWVKDGTPPPPSAYPRIDKATLVDWSQKSTGFPALPGVRYPEVIQQPGYYDHGTEIGKGILTKLPPELLGRYKVRVPKCDADGNDLGTLLPVEVAVPLATYTGWNLRRRDVGAEAMLANLAGSYFPFAKTKAERETVGDPRRSIEERYPSFEEYRQRFAATCDDMVKRRVLLKEDADRLIAGREKVRGVFAK
jgi:Alpha/beta hydrolase domain